MNDPIPILLDQSRRRERGREREREREKARERERERESERNDAADTLSFKAEAAFPLPCTISFKNLNSRKVCYTFRI
jgi:hypothetical protein